MAAFSIKGMNPHRYSLNTITVINQKMKNIFCIFICGGLYLLLDRICYFISVEVLKSGRKSRILKLERYLKDYLLDVLAVIFSSCTNLKLF